MSETPKTCGVVGGGQMGAGIAHALLLAGSTVRLLERDESAASAAHDRVKTLVRRTVERGLLDEAQSVLTRLGVTTDPAELSDAGLVVEAVPEDLDLKLSTLSTLASYVSPDAVLATNTSSLSVDLLSQAVPNPERVIGLHFFNPVPSSRLVEVVLSSRTSPELRRRAEEWVLSWGKTPVTVRDAPGFASSRLGLAIGLEAIRMLEEGVASAEDIDAAMTLGYGFPVGPLKLTDLVGLDVRLGISRYLSSELGPRFAPPALMVQMVQQGKLGRKSGQGFYSWDEVAR
ncbi:3-hydroxyacyl-CoA dehydrogenase family protein [Nocardioides sp. 1609]|uniref:3-hydroxyacyl-CoA dehydrogenase family protein n=1 Tax=Nocardioides sp. 1609 TaxID=2508327 RepID=UPI00106FD5D6|nr:3-hydroxyacyl-CoA dehydrogenase family protein [Nocardioides sp. 1609]